MRPETETNVETINLSQKMMAVSGTSNKTIKPLHILTLTTTETVRTLTQKPQKHCLFFLPPYTTSANVVKKRPDTAALRRYCKNKKSSLDITVYSRLGHRSVLRVHIPAEILC